MGSVKNAFHDEINSATCNECQGEGWTSGTDYEDRCCGGSDWECGARGCTGPVQEQVQTQEPCEHCRTTGLCGCEDCVNTASENAFSDMCESEPPLSADERYQMAAREKQELRR